MTRSTGLWASKGDNISAMNAEMRSTIRVAFAGLAIGWSYAAVYALRRTTIHKLLPHREVLGRHPVKPGDVATLSSILDWMAVAWVVLPVLLLVCVLVVASVGIGHVALLMMGVVNAPAFPIAAAYFPLDPALAVLALAYLVVVVILVATFLRALASR